jgi:DNA polymerase-3 subunit gamma/tau
VSLALYRKYRPGTFAEVVGQEHVTEPLQRALANGRVGHAYLFSGPRGCGKTSSARILARSLNCVQGPTPTPCGVCDSCVALRPDGPGSLDVIEIDAASHNGVDDARDLRERAFFAPVSSRFKIYIIDEAHMITAQGFNALLKLVEEPPDFVTFVFATTEPERVLPTIRSRTQHYPFRLVPPSVLRDHLAAVSEAEGVAVEPPVLPLVVRAGAGSVRDSLSVLDQLLAGAGPEGVTLAGALALLGYTDAALLDEVVDAIAARDAAALYEAVDRVVEGGTDPRRFAADLLERFRDLVVLEAVPGAADKGLLDGCSPDQVERMTGQATRLGRAELSRAADLLHAGLVEMRGTTSPRLLLELVCARVLLPAAASDESSVLARLERLERRLAIAGQERPDGPAGMAPPASVPSPDPRPVPVDEPAERSAPGREGERAGAGASGGRPTEAGRADRGRPSGGRADGGRPDGTRPDDAGPADARPDAGWPAARRPGSGDRPSTPPRAVAEEALREVRAPEGRPPTSAAPAPAAPETAAPAPAAASGGGLDAAAVRRVWPEVLQAVKARNRVAWTMLSSGVGVTRVDRGEIVLEFEQATLIPGFVRAGRDIVLREALLEVLGAELKVLAVPAGEAAAGRRTPAAPRGAEPPPPAYDDAVDPDDDVPPDEADDPGAGGQGVSGEDVALALVKAGLGGRVIGGTDAG